MGVLPSIDISATGLSAMRRKMNAIASNIANVETTRTEEGGPYRRIEVLMEEGPEPVGFPFILRQSSGRLAVTHQNHLQDIYEKTPEDRKLLHGVEGNIQIADDPPKLVYDPNHPDADENGYVAMPNINVIEEMVDLIVATRAYEANLTVIQADKELAKEALNI
ncbi:MAG: flagellar basal body rod protein FlgC [candidate division KSB1 bacterium]|nr:flagellar basal body rod protein FlgC [candidate division KSB1 bacterium]